MVTLREALSSAVPMQQIASMGVSYAPPKEQLPFIEIVPGEPEAFIEIVPTPTQGSPDVKPGVRLFKFQQEAVEWLRDKPGAILADEMGVGKTAAGIAWGVQRRPVLVICPASLVLNWSQKEIQELWRRNDSVVVLDGQVDFPRPLPDWTVCSFGQVARYLGDIEQAGYQAVIVDEAHGIRNLNTAQSQNVLDIVAPEKPTLGQRIPPYRLALTGTPIKNTPMDAFPLMLFIGLRTWDDLPGFRYMVRQRGDAAAQAVYHLLKPVMLRRKKADVYPDLPPKVHETLVVPITTADEYELAEGAFLKWLQEQEGTLHTRAQIEAQALVRLQALRGIAAMGKVAPVADWLTVCGTGGMGETKALIFSTRIEPLELLQKRHPSSILYTGSLSKEDRQAFVDRFQREPGLCYFMGTYGAAGVGITLTAADSVVLFDLPWTPADKQQAEDRAHRFGQKRTVEVYNVLAKNTVDERVLELLDEKEQVISEAVEGTSAGAAAKGSVAGELLRRLRREASEPGRSHQGPYKYVSDDEAEAAWAEQNQEKAEQGQEAPWLSDSPFTQEQVDRFNTYTHFPLDINRDFNGMVRQKEEEIKQYLASVRISAVPSGVSDALSLYRKAVYNYYLEESRARLIAPPVSVVGPARYGERARPERAERISRNAISVVEEASDRMRKALRASTKGMVRISEETIARWMPLFKESKDRLAFGKRHAEIIKEESRAKTNEEKTRYDRDILSGQWDHVLRGQGRKLYDDLASVAAEEPITPAQPRLFQGRQPSSLYMALREAAMGQIPDDWGSRCRDPLGRWTISDLCPPVPRGEVAATAMTFALSADGNRRYDFEHRVVEATDLITSHDPFTFELNSRFTQKLQPRKRERAATQVQVQEIAKDLKPLSLLTDFRTFDRGAPIVGPDMLVESGNGRVMGYIRASKEYPGRVAAYRGVLLAHIGEFGLTPADVEDKTLPILIRMRVTTLTDAERQKFVEEANLPSGITRSAVEIARTDAERITLDLLLTLDVGEEDTLYDALKATRNRVFVQRFLGTLPENERGHLLDSQGVVNLDGIRRIGQAVFVYVFRGETGLRLAELAFETLDNDIRNAFGGIARALGPMAQAEALTTTGARTPDLAIGEDLATTLRVYVRLRGAGTSLADYLAQGQLESRELTPFQEDVLKTVAGRARSARRIGEVLRRYSESVIAQPPPSQGSMFGDVRITKEELWQAARAGEQMDYESETVERARRREERAEPGLVVAQLRQAIGLASRDPKASVDWCNLDPERIDSAWAWRPFRDAIAEARGLRAIVQVCGSELSPDSYLLSADFTGTPHHGILVGEVMSNYRRRAKAALRDNAREVLEFGTNRVIFEVVLPGPEPQDLTFSPRLLPTLIPRREEGTMQPALFQAAQAKPFKSPTQMIAWQFKVLIAELQLLTLHASDPTCPCGLADIGEFCHAKHILSISALAWETASMDADPVHHDLLVKLGDEANDLHMDMRVFVQSPKDAKSEVSLVEWSRTWRKQLEGIYYSKEMRRAENKELATVAMGNFPIGLEQVVGSTISGLGWALGAALAGFVIALLSKKREASDEERRREEARGGAMLSNDELLPMLDKLVKRLVV